MCMCRCVSSSSECADSTEFLHFLLPSGPIIHHFHKTASHVHTKLMYKRPYWLLTMVDP